MLPNVSDPAEYGLPKTDYDSNGVVDQETEVLAAEWEAMGVDVAAMSHVSPKAIVVCTVAGGAVTITAYRSVWGDTLAVRPVATYTGAGDYTLTWSAAGHPDLNPTPARCVTRAPSFIAATVTPASVVFQTITTTANTVRVVFTNSAGAATDANFALLVY